MINVLICVFHLNAIVSGGALGRVSCSLLCFCRGSFVMGFVGWEARVEE